MILEVRLEWSDGFAFHQLVSEEDAARYCTEEEGYCIFERFEREDCTSKWVMDFIDAFEASEVGQALFKAYGPILYAYIEDVEEQFMDDDDGHLHFRAGDLFDDEDDEQFI